MRRALAPLVLAVCSCAVCSCGPVKGPVINARDYDQTCGSVDDCEIVLEGEVCGCGTPSAVNVSDSESFGADARALRDQCVDNPFIIVDCFQPDFVATCVDGQCGAAPTPQPPRFSFASPISAETIPTNAFVTGTVVQGTDPNEELRPRIIVDDGEPRDLAFQQRHCAVIGGCEDAIELAPLPANASVRLVFEPATEGLEASWRTGAGPDTTPPTVEAVSLANVGVFRDNTGTFKQVTLDYVTPSDETGVANYGLLRSVDGGEPLLVERIVNFSNGNQAFDAISEAEGFREACYSLLAWDWAGNEAVTDPLCIDVAISEEEKQSVSSNCGSTRASGFALALLALGVGRRLRVKPAR